MSSSPRKRHAKAERDAGRARSTGEQQDLAGRMSPRRGSGAAEHAGDVVGVADDIEDAHAAAALSADRDVDGEHAGEEACPPEAARPRRRLGRLIGAVVRGGGEVERELQLGRGDGRGWNDAGAEVMVTCEHPKVAGHVKTGRGHECAQTGEEFVRRHVGVGGTAAPGGLEEDADPAVGERLHGVVGEGRPQHVAADSLELLAVATVDGRRGM